MVQRTACVGFFLLVLLWQVPQLALLGSSYGTCTANPNPNCQLDLQQDSRRSQLGGQVSALNPLVSDANADLNGDVPSKTLEYQISTDPNMTDSDNDGMPDAWEILYGLNPLVNDADGDLDGDGLSNVQEYECLCDPSDPDSDDDQLLDGPEVIEYGTDPLVADSDGDLLGDGEEVLTYGTNPLKVDTDGDTLIDGVEVLQYGTDPKLYDSDGDGLDDGTEVRNGTNPLVADSTLDGDGDGLSNAYEIQLGTDPFDSDTDNDGMSDGDEVAQGRDPLRYNAPVDSTGIGVIGLVAGSVVFAGFAFVSTEIRVFRYGRPVKPRNEAGGLTEVDAKEETE